MADRSLDLTQLRTLVAIDVEGGFGRAAEALHLSQPTVSQHVRSLEDRLGVALVERDGRRRRFTTDGERLLAEARRILAVHDSALSRLIDVPRPELVVGIAETATDLVTPELIDAVRAAYDQPVRFRIDRSTQLAEATARGQLDLALLLDANGTQPGVTLETLALRWYSAPGADTRDDTLSLVAYVEPCGIRNRVLRVLADEGRPVEVAAESTTLSGIVAAVRTRLGVAAIPGSAPEGLVEDRRLPGLGTLVAKVATRPGLAPRTEEPLVAAASRFLRARVHAL